MSRVFVLVATLLLAACSGWDKPIYRDAPSDGHFLLGHWITDDDYHEVFQIIADEGRYFIVALDKDGATTVRFYVTHHNDTIYLSIDLTSMRHLSVRGDQPVIEKNDHPRDFNLLSVKKAEDGILIIPIDIAALSKLLEAKGVSSTQDLCRSVRVMILDDEKPNLIERCAVVNSEFVERTLGDVALPVATDKQQLAKPVHY